MYIISFIAIIGILLGLINIVKSFSNSSKGDIGKAEELISKVEMPIESDYYGYYYDKKIVKASDLNDKMIILLGINNIVNNTEEEKDTISKESLKKSIDSFLLNAKYQDQSISVGKCYGSISEYKDGIYSLKGSCKSNNNEGYMTKVIKVKETKNKMIVKTKVIYVVYSFKNSKKPVQYVYENADKKKLKAKIKSDDLLIINKTNRYYKKGKTYNYTFIKEKGNYYFDSVKKG